MIDNPKFCSNRGNTLPASDKFCSNRQSAFTDERLYNQHPTAGSQKWSSVKLKKQRNTKKKLIPGMIGKVFIAWVIASGAILFNDSLCENLSTMLFASPNSTYCTDIYRAGWYLGRSCSFCRYNKGDTRFDQIIVHTIEKSSRYLERSDNSCSLRFRENSQARYLSSDLKKMAERLSRNPNSNMRHRIANTIEDRYQNYATALRQQPSAGESYPQGICLEKYFRIAFLLEYSFHALSYADKTDVSPRLREQAKRDGFRFLDYAKSEIRDLDQINRAKSHCGDLTAVELYVL